jgi:diguanylate cyclase (GGDEF)-like protein
MTSLDKAFEMLLELAKPGERPTRAELLDRALRTAMVLTEADAVVILNSSRRGGERLVLHAGSAVLAALQVPPEGSEVMRSMAQSHQPLLVTDLSNEPKLLASDGCPGVEAGPVLYVPLHQPGVAPPSYIAAFRKRGRARFGANETRSILLLGAWLSSTLENLRLTAGNERLAVTDDLTDVYNFRFFKNALRREMRRATRYEQELAVVAVEIDRMSESEDENGELRSSLLLKELALVLARQVRSFDLLARTPHGFVLILPQTSREGAMDVAERMRSAVERHRFSVETPSRVTVSLGVSSFPQDAADVDGLVAATERALELARQRGRNCVATLTRQAA